MGKAWWEWRKAEFHREKSAEEYMFMFAGVTGGLKGGGGGGGFRSFTAFKRSAGPAGAGRHWHHVVEQTPGNVRRFGAEGIHDADNLVSVEAGVHARISGFYSSKQPFTGGKTVREWLSDQPLEAQRTFGEQVLRDYGVIK